MLRRHFQGLTASLRRHWLLWVVVLALVGGGTLLAGPHASAWYHRYAGESALKSYHNEKARNHLSACLKVWPKDVKALLLAARAARRDGDYTTAQQHVHDAQEANGGSSSEIALEAKLIDASMGLLNDQGEDYLHTRAEKEPVVAPLIWEALAEGYTRMHRILDAFACLEKWLTREPDNVQALYLRGSVSLAVRANKRAIPDFRRVVELDPERDEARRRLAFCLLETHYLDEAIEHFEYLRRRDPDNPELLVRMARCEHGLGNAKKAKQILDTVLEESPDYGPALLARGHLDRLAGKPADAEDHLRAAVKYMPYDYQAHFELKDVLRQRGKESEARAIEDKGEKLKAAYDRLEKLTTHELNRRPHDPALHYELGMILMSLGHKKMGAHWLSSALNKDESFAPAYEALAEYYEGTGDTEAAEYHRKKAAELKAAQ
jgi:tetratricopeptide (TPR) repeat protein